MYPKYYFSFYICLYWYLYFYIFNITIRHSVIHLHSLFYYLLRNQLWGTRILLISHIFASMNIWNQVNCGSVVNWKAQKRKCGVTKLWGTSFTSYQLGCIAVYVEQNIPLSWMLREKFESGNQTKLLVSLKKKKCLKFYLNNLLYRTVQFL